MLKAQDVVILLKLLAQEVHLNWSQQQLGTHLCLSASAVNSSLARLRQARLLNVGTGGKRYKPILAACEEFLSHAVQYFFAADVGDYTAGIPTSYAAPIFQGKITLGAEPFPVWSSAHGTQRGLALKPLYHCIPDALLQYPDQEFYDLLALIDAIRQGRAREKDMAKKLLIKRLHREHTG